MGISKDVISFLKKLSKNNNRNWFKEHKEDYLKAKEEFDKFVNQLFELLMGPYELDYTSPKNCLYRIYRDVRFSKNKTPYKTSMSANISAWGKKAPVSGIYIHIDPTEGCFIAGGMYQPDSASLQALRSEILDHGDKLLKILNSASIKTHFGELQGSTLKTAPRGIDKDHKYIKLLRHKDFILTKSLPLKEVQSKDFDKLILKKALAIKPFLDFLNHSIRKKPILRK